MENFYEQSDDHSKCRYSLWAIKTCRGCLFETLCRLEEQKEQRAKQEG